MLEVPMFDDFARSEGLEYTDTIDAVAAEIRRLWAARGIRRRPSVAIMDWPTTYPLFERSMGRIASLLRDRGVNAIPCHVGQATVHGGRLHVGDLPIDVLYRIFLIEDLLDEPERMEPILAAHRAGTLILAMSFAAELVGNKASLALLSDATAQGSLSDGERDLVERYVPWTRIVRAGPTTWKGRSAGMLDIATRHRSAFVLKPIIGHGGADVMPGWTTPEHEWHAAIQAALRGPVSHVLQERVRPDAEWMPLLTSDDVEFEDVMLNWGAFVVGDAYAGCIIRGNPVGGNPVINITNGAAVGCCVHAGDGRARRSGPHGDGARSKDAGAPTTGHSGLTGTSPCEDVECGRDT